jgi:hypothetical protein
MDVSKLSRFFSSIATQVVGNKSNATNPGKFSKNNADSFVSRDSSSVGQALAQQPNPSVIPVGQSAPHLAKIFEQAA